MKQTQNENLDLEKDQINQTEQKKTNRNFKDSIFSDLFCKDSVDGKKNFLDLYNNIHGFVSH